jgi:cytochrome c oxidase cbb3-type subunit IV
MMQWGHDAVVLFSKSWGLFYLLAMALAVVVYTFWPSNKRKFDSAKRAILRKEDKP